MQSHKSKLISRLLVIVCIMTSFSGHLTHADAGGPNDVVAVVNGETISYHDIETDPKMLSTLYASELNTDQLAKEKQRNEMRRLLGKIQMMIREQQIIELGLTATEREVRSKVDETFEKAGFTDDKAKMFCEQISAVYDALLEWYENPSKSDAIYNEKLSGRHITRQQWKLFQLCYDTPEKLKHLNIPKNIDDMKMNSQESIRRDILHQKLDNIT